ncbi:MAG: hypothetical protein AB1656_11995 [Candidatus Omnitrophota bacterium]
MNESPFSSSCVLRRDPELLRSLLSAIETADKTEQNLYEAFEMQIINDRRYQRLHAQLFEVKWMLLEILKKLSGASSQSSLEKREITK